MSLKGDKYETAEEIRFRLEHTVVMYDNNPVYISKVQVPEDLGEKDEIARVFFYELPLKGGGRNAEVRKYLSSKKFDLTPIKMGYMNYNAAAGGGGNRAVFIQRAPVRQNKQGLCQQTTSFHDPRGRADQNINYNMMINSQGFVDMIKGKYPDFKAAGDLLGAGEFDSVAVSRSFSFVVENDLDCLIMVHKGLKCGLALKGDKALKIPPKFHFLREEMEACRIPIA